MPKSPAKMLTALAIAALSAVALTVYGSVPDRAAGELPARGRHAPVCRVRSTDFVRTARAKGQLQAETVSTIATEVSHHFITWRLPEGAQVEKGDPVLKLDRGGLEEDILEVKGQIVAAEAAVSAAEGSFERTKVEIEAGIEELEAKLAVAEARMEYEQGKPLPERRRAAEAAARKATARLTYAEYWRDMMLRMLEEDLVGRREVRRAELDCHTATVEVRRTEKALAETLKGASREDLGSAQVALDEARLSLKEARGTRDQRIEKARAEAEAARNQLATHQRRLSQLREDLEKTTLRAAHAGAVFSHGDRKFSVGDPVWRGQVVADLADISSLVMRARVRECDSQLVKEGQTVTVHLLSPMEEPVSGTVSEVGTSLTEEEGSPEVRYLDVKVKLETVPRGAKPGMNAYADIRVETLRDALVLPRAAVKRNAITVLTDSGPQEREVELLATGELLAAVKGSVAEGEWVLLNTEE
jgi:multidrug resistance efflux pump